MLFRGNLKPGLSILLVLTLALTFWVLRGIGVLGPSHLRWLLPLSFSVMVILPWILLTASGRRQIGLRKPIQGHWYLKGAAMGAAAAFGCFLTGFLLFGHTEDNWYITIGNNFKNIMDTSAMSFLMLNLMFTLPAIMFSPFGEEIFYRGVVQETLQQKISMSTSTLIECSLFGLAHLVHHGLVMTATGLEFLWISGPLWMLQMILVSWMFAWLRMKSGSLLVPIVSHVVFNLTMNQTIFLLLW